MKPFRRIFMWNGILVSRKEYLRKLKGKPGKPKRLILDELQEEKG